MAAIGILVGLIGAAVGLVVGLVGGLVGAVLGLLGGSLAVLPHLFPLVLIILGILWLVKGADASRAVGIPAEREDVGHPPSSMMTR